MSRRNQILADNPLIFLELEETSGNPVNSGSSALTYTVGSGVTRGVTGIDGKAWALDGSANGSVQISGTSQAVYSDNVFSVEWWVKCNDTTTQVISYLNQSGAAGHVQFNINASGKADVSVWTTTPVASLVSTTTIRSATQWHHVVLTVNGNTKKLYINGNLEVTNNTNIGTLLPTSPRWDLGLVGSASSAAVTIDNFAVYDSELSAARVADHFSGGAAPVNGGYTAQVGTATALMVNPAVATQTIINRNINAAPMTATANMPTATGRGNISVVGVTEDTSTQGSSPNNNYGNDPTVTLGVAQKALFKFPTNVRAGETITSAKLRLVATNSAASITHDLARIDTDWSEATATYNNTTVTVVGQVTTPAVSAGTVFEVEVAPALGDYGVALVGPFSGPFFSVHSSEATNSANRPTVTLASGPAAAINNIALPATATALMVDPVVSTASGVSASGTPMTATAAMPSAVVSADRTVALTAEPMSAAAELAGGDFSSPVSVSAQTMDATATATEATAGTERGAVIASKPMTATISWKQPEAVNGAPIVLNESEDAYFQRVNNLGPESWWRLNDKTSTVIDRIGGDANGSYQSVLFGQADGPEGRFSASFNGTGYIKGGPIELSLGAGTLEFSFRTTRANSFLVYSSDDRTTPSTTVDEPGREIYLNNGRITFKTYYFQNSLGGQPEPTTFSGVRNLADGKWHHVVVRPFSGYNGTGTEIWVDGKFEVRRYNAGGWHGMPDLAGGGPGIPTSQYLVGDMSEIAFYEKTISSDDITRNYYAFMGWAPIAAEPMESFAFTPAGALGKGNQKKALYLYWDTKSEFEKGGTAAESVEFDPMTDFVSGANTLPVGDYHGFKVFAKPVTSDGKGASYRDPLTDEQSLINLETDVDLRQYDVIMFRDWPDEGPELDFVEATFPGQKERLIQQLRDANDAGMGLFITNPRLAIDLGIIDRVEFVPSLYESKVNSSQGAARGLYDYGSAVKFPWNITASDGLVGGQFAAGIGQSKISDPAYLANKAFFYSDTNKNDRFRVRAIVEGLTDIPSYMIQDAVFHVDYDPWGWQGVAYKYLKREGGLQIGDEYIFNGAEIIAARFEDAVERRYNRYNGVWATPIANVKAGTVVTTFGATLWNGTQQVANPYKDYATTIVLEPGDSLNGKRVGGKIFVNFTEQPSRGLGVPVQVLPEATNDVVWPFQYPVETAEQREWDYSWTRTTLQSTSSTSPTAVTVTLPDGRTTVIPINSGAGDNLAMVRSSQLFPVIGKPRMEMDARGLLWLSERAVVNEGDVVVRATPMTATAAAVKPAVVAQRDAATKARPMVALAVATKVAEDTSGDADVYTLPLTAAATMTGYGKTIVAAPMTANAELVENFDAVYADGEQVVLYLHGVDVTLFIKEEA